MALCNFEGCRLPEGHNGSHNRFPSTAWGFFAKKDKDKIAKAGFATPRGGAKNAYQNHVIRNNRVIIPYEKFHHVNADLYEDGYVIRLFPEQYFESANQPREEFRDENASIKVGVNAFILYRTWSSF